MAKRAKILRPRHGLATDVAAAVDEHLRALHDSGRSDTDVGAALGKCAQTVFRWRTGRGRPDPANAERILTLAVETAREVRP